MIHIPFAYVGPGAGFAFLGSFFSIVLSLLAGVASLLLWPFRALARMFRCRVKSRVVVLGVEGPDPDAIEKLLLRSGGPYRRLRAGTSGGWATPAFWKTLGDHAVDSTVLLVPGASPNKGFKGRMLYRTASGQIVSQPSYYARYLSRLLGPLSNSGEALFFSALDHQKRGLLACNIDSAPELDRIARRLETYSDANTTVFILSDRGALFSNRGLDAEIHAMEDLSPAILRIFGFA